MKIIYYAVPGFVTLLLTELAITVVAHRVEHRGYELRDTLASLGMGIGNLIVGIPGKALHLALLSLCYEHRLFNIEMVWWAWLLLFLGEDLCYYNFHRAGHEVRIGWSAHVNHHSSEHYNLSTALRQSWTTPFTTLAFWWPLALIGFKPSDIFIMTSISLIYQFWIHTERIDKLGPLEWVFNTPSHHRVHHASDLEYLDANYGGILIIWDRLFGSFRVEEHRPTYGLLHNIKTFNLFTIAFHDWAELFRDLRKPGATMMDRLRYIFAPPGWSHDGSKQTVAQLREEAARQAGGHAGEGADADAPLPDPSEIAPA